MEPGVRTDELLLEAARSLGSAAGVGELSERVHALLVRLPGIISSGLVSHDAERQSFLVHGLLYGAEQSGGRRLNEPVEFEVGERPGAAHDPILLDLGAEAPTAFHQALQAHGARAFVDIPMAAPHRMIGSLFAAFRAPPPLDAWIHELLVDLARIATPSLWNCFTHEWIRRGDRRREVLIELSRSINTSLEHEAVIDAALAALEKLGDEHEFAIDVLTSDGLAFRRWRPRRDAASGGEQHHDAPPFPVSFGALQAVLERRAAYQSDDLAVRCAFDDDRAWLRDGLRRYVATPLLARGRILGAMLVGYRDPKPPLRIDLWLYDNVAIQLALALDNAAKHQEVQRLSRSLQEQNIYLREEIQSEHAFGEIVGRSPAIREVLKSISRVAPTDSIVLITGETGVGKELVARAIHAAGARAAQPMVKVNCAAIPEGTVESELFGHERGAFTSAVERRIGRFELARDGTLFLDEVGELPLPVQAKLLRVLQDGEFERVGGSRTLSSNARIVAATNRNLAYSVEAGQFRRDLFYRLNVFPIHVPPLRERREDIPLLIEAFIAQLARRMGRRIDSVDAAFLDDLCCRPWHGNVRELRHEIERALILCDGNTLTGERASGPTRASATPPPLPAAPLRLMDTIETRAASPEPQVRLGAESRRSLDDVEAEHIRRVLESTRGVIEGPRGAARVLGLTPSTLRFRMKRLGVKRRSDDSTTAGGGDHAETLV